MTSTAEIRSLCPEGVSLFERHPSHFSSAVYTKGVFITTSSFAASAREFVARGSTTKVVLVDGEMLIDLMLRHGIGVRVVERYELHELDQNYFEELE